MAIIEIDKGSGFCFGVTTAISKAEEELNKTGHLYCLGDIVHNTAEVDRLASRGLETITHEQLEQLHDVKVLLRAHGEPPETYEIARRNRIEIIDATCPVVLKLQQRINATYNTAEEGKPAPQIVIYVSRTSRRLTRSTIAATSTSTPRRPKVCRNSGTSSRRSSAACSRG